MGQDLERDPQDHGVPVLAQAILLRSPILPQSPALSF